MSQDESKKLILNVKDLSFKSEQHVEDLVRSLAEMLPQIDINRDGNEIAVLMPKSLSKKALKLRIKKFLYKKGLNKDFRPISLKSDEKDGYTIKEKKIIELSYY